ncbi:FkbM family methyltransferase [Desulfurivibrio dismutans]|uniref:FkbM family methyltransferase n=1 Tax=Desulfurivibrio dismutans TaxID=1398908 RepID=UPI0023DAE266|nr:FkbM family methyltransferase [Desulfurivibrio alkaliphilus]MDF1615253.1 FkbM family methyltransferase [Desulfurivibrio alkaliphilus]
MSKIFLYPPFLGKSELDNIISRLAWYFKPYLDRIEEIHVASTHIKVDAVNIPHFIDPSIKDELPAILSRLRLLDLSNFNKEIAQFDPAEDLILLWKEGGEAQAPKPLVAAIEAAKKKSGFWRVDPVKDRLEGSHYLHAGWNKFANQADLIRKNREKFEAMASLIGHHRKCYVFGTGPSLSEFSETKDFSDGISVISNSIVKNTEILEKTNPKIIVAADPLYHAGCSTYAADFRAELVEAMRRTSAYFLCPMRDYSIYESCIPESLLDRVIGIPFDKKSAPVTDLGTNFCLKPYPNILTLMLLPVASTFSDHISVVGCDGRKITENEFFWSHDKKAQFNERMADIQQAHPGFFAINYNNYYLGHSRDLEESACAIESAGKTICSETPSFIPALHSRSGNDQWQAALHTDVIGVKSIVILDPDAKGLWGHFLAYDKRIAEAVSELDYNMAVISRKDIDPTLFPRSVDRSIGVFSHHSWDYGNKNNAAIKEVALAAFVKELHTAITELDLAFSKGRIVIYFYTGSIEAAELVEFLLIEFPRFSAVINLFWSYNKDHHDEAYRNRWRPVMQRMLRSGQVVLTHSTTQIAEQYKRDWGVVIPVLPHPSTTFGDDKGRLVSLLQGSGSSHKPVRILFPGGASRAKGFLLSVYAASELSSNTDLEVILRAKLDMAREKPGNDHGAELINAFESVDKTAIQVLDQELSDDDFIRMMSGSDVVVLPYLPDAFERRTSGILIDSIILGKPVVVVKGTWLSDIVKDTGIGVSADATALSVRQSVAEVVRRLGVFQTNVKRARERYLRENSWANLVETIVSLGVRTEVPINKVLKVGDGETSRKIVAPRKPAPLKQPAVVIGTSNDRSNHVLIFHPTLVTAGERDFWDRMIDTLRERGYYPIVISFSNVNEFISCPRIFIPIQFDIFNFTEDFASSRKKYQKLCAEFNQTVQGKEAFESLVESILNCKTIAEKDKAACFSRVIEGVEIFVGYILDLIAKLNPAQVIVNNDTLPLHFIAHRCAKSLSIPAIYSERSPVGSQWFEPDGFYAQSHIPEFIADSSWEKPGSHEETGRFIIDQLRSFPAAHRILADPVSQGANITAVRKNTKRTFLLALDAVKNTGWAQQHHPLRAENYPLFKTPEGAVLYLADMARRFSARLVVKPHPSDEYGKHMSLPEGVELFEGDISEALNSSNVVFCFLTKVAWATMAMRKPLVTLGPNVAALSGIAFHCEEVSDIEEQIGRALEFTANEKADAKLHRFVGFIGKYYFVENDCSNKGADRFLNKYFPERDAAKKIEWKNISRADMVNKLQGIDLTAPDLLPSAATGDLGDLDIVYGPFSRSRERLIDEVEIVKNLFRWKTLSNKKRPSIMLDVGACQGDSFKSFLEAGWHVHAFEPNPPMHERIKKKYAKNKDLIVNQLAVSEVTGNQVPFYTSEESIGISSLSSFRDSHRQTAVVDTIRLDDYCLRNNIDSVDFLKIDTEGFDLMVLKGNNWTSIQPRVIICEFENAKTEKLGYCFEDIASYLHVRGYQVFVSEWHPITRYGSGEHRWRAMHRWPSKLIDRNAWGNLIGFREPVAIEIMELATRHALYQSSLVFARKARLEATKKRSGRPKERGSFVDLEQALVGPFTRSECAHWDETSGIAQLFSGFMCGSTMIDVGAHGGSALMPFIKKGWEVFAFEPDDKNRTKLLERLAKNKNKHLVSLDTRCVSNKSQKGVSFYQSEQSTGISGLSAFHESHVEAQKVDVTTLTEFFRDNPMPAVDFLKIDTEGHDLFVLQGYPWDRGKPAVIECEFEDVKTVPLGYTFHDLSRFLVDKGYTVYVSEWHPIIRYGIQHDWNRLVRYPCELADPKGWGNLLAFRDPIDEQALVVAVKKVLKISSNTNGDALAKTPTRINIASNLDIREANQAFRNGDFSTALQMYLELHKIRPLRMYKDNALRAAKRLGVMPSVIFKE